MVGLPQHRHHLPFHKLPAVVAGRAVKPLEVQGAQIVSVPHEEAAASHVAATDCTHTETHTGLNRSQTINISTSAVERRDRSGLWW